MAEPRADQTPDDETLVTPRFDEEETVLAQPVVPLEAADELPPAAPSAARHYGPRAPRGPWPLALILVSALVGSVIGGTGLYFFQKHRRAEAAPEQPVASAEMTQPAPAPTAEQSAPLEVSQPEPATSVEEPPAAEPAPERVAEDDDEEEPRAEPAPARNLPVREEAPRRGKKGDRDAEPLRRERDTSSDDVTTPAPRQPRRVDSIVYPTRREERRSQRQAERRARRAERQAERLRAIFEGEQE